jgi:hypothetical protein
MKGRRTQKSIVTNRLNQLQGKRTLRAFSELVGIGQSTMHNYLKGRSVPDYVLKKICIATGCKAGWLLGLESNFKIPAHYKEELIKAVNNLKNCLEGVSDE